MTIDNGYRKKRGHFVGQWSEVICLFPADEKKRPASKKNRICLQCGRNRDPAKEELNGNTPKEEGGGARGGGRRGDNGGGEGRSKH